MGFGAPSAKGRALAHLARREHSRRELERKLARKVEDSHDASAAEQIASALDDLAAKGLQSDERTAESLLAGRGQRFGSRRLEQLLRQKGLAADLVADTVARARSTELDRARDLWRRRFGDVPAAEPAERARQMRFLAARGFAGDVIRQVVRGDTGEDDDA